MINRKLVLPLLAGICVGALNAGAIPYSDYDPINNVLSSSYSTYTGTFQIDTTDGDWTIANAAPDWNVVGYDSNTQYVTSAFAQFSFWDADDNIEMVSIELGSEPLLPDPSPIMIGFTTKGGITASAMIELQDGSVGYSVSWTEGDAFTLAGAGLFAQADSKPVDVPEGGATLGLLGLGLVGLASFKRMRFAHA